nr:MAG TPA: tail assembly chaperone protein [Caudoviricetes sp.]
MATKTVEIAGKEVTFKASAAIPRIYRISFNRDIFKDLMDLRGAVKSSETGESTLSNADLEVFENVAYLMAKHADPTQPENINDWLDQFDMFAIYEVLPVILDLWTQNINTQIESKKKLEKLAGK